MLRNGMSEQSETQEIAGKGKAPGRGYLIPRVHLENVRPPPGLLATRPLDEGHTLGRGHREAVRVSGDVLGGGHLQDAGHVDPRLRHRLGLQEEGNYEKP